MKIFKKRKTIDISGFGGCYEETCQILLAIGEEWFKNKPLSMWKWKKEKKSGYWYGHLKNEFREETNPISHRWYLFLYNGQCPGKIFPQNAPH